MVVCTQKRVHFLPCTYMTTSMNHQPLGSPHFHPSLQLDCTNIKRSQLNFLRLLSSTATQVIKYHGDASPDVNFKLANGAKVPASAITIADKVRTHTYVGACVYKPIVSLRNAVKHPIRLCWPFCLNLMLNIASHLVCSAFRDLTQSTR